MFSSRRIQTCGIDTTVTDSGAGGKKVYRDLDLGGPREGPHTEHPNNIGPQGVELISHRLFRDIPQAMLQFAELGIRSHWWGKITFRSSLSLLSPPSLLSLLLLEF